MPRVKLNFSGEIGIRIPLSPTNFTRVISYPGRFPLMPPRAYPGGNDPPFIGPQGHKKRHSSPKLRGTSPRHRNTLGHRISLYPCVGIARSLSQVAPTDTFPCVTTVARLGDSPRDQLAYYASLPRTRLSRQLIACTASRYLAKAVTGVLSDQRD